MGFIPTLIETIRVRGGVAPLWHLHLRRLSESCRALGVPFPLRFDVPAGGPDRVVRLEVGPGGMTVTTRELPAIAPARLVTATTRLTPYPHKTTDRKVFVAAADEARRAAADDALVLAPDGELAECCIWSLFWWEADRVAAPASSLGVLRSISRMRIEEVAGPLAESRLQRSQVGGRTLFLANAVRGVVPVTELDGKPVPANSRTDALARAFWP